MRYIGNKTRLLPFILRTLRRSGIDVGSAHDAFAGTASVSRALKENGWRVHSSDLLMSSYVFQRAYVVAESAGRDVEELASELAALPPRVGFISRHFSPAAGDGKSGRMYFTPENAARIDAAREELETWRGAGKIGDDDYYILLAAIIEGADRVANTAGVYASYMKRWQPNAKRAFGIVPEKPIKGGQPAEAHLMDATDAAKRIGEVDLVYIDPPYNSRQYVAYYHIPEILARGWTESAPAIRGKVGLLAGSEGRSQVVAWPASQEAVFRAARRHGSQAGAGELQFRGAPRAGRPPLIARQRFTGREGVALHPELSQVPCGQREGGQALPPRHRPRAPLPGPPPLAWLLPRAQFVWSG